MDINPPDKRFHVPFLLFLYTSTIKHHNNVLYLYNNFKNYSNYEKDLFHLSSFIFFTTYKL